MTSTLDPHRGITPRVCRFCRAPLRVDAEFCGTCGRSTVGPAASASAKDLDADQRHSPRLLPIAYSVAFLAVFALASYAVVSVRHERNARRAIAASTHTQLANANDEIAALQAQDAALAKRLGATQKTLSQSKAGIAPLAARVLKSVFTIETSNELGTGWAAWTWGARRT